ncbi:MAG TPA: DUF1592 domain-containing protein [Polyangiaceae bacterium]|nr:DUF1592 domain-containing protein [Polyangiaceae bacterium]
MSRLKLVAAVASLFAAAVAAPACGSDDKPTFPDDEDPITKDGFEPAPGGMRRMLATEYVRTVELLLGAQASVAAQPPVDVAQEGFDAIGNSILSLSAEPVELYERSAEAVAQAAITDKGRLAIEAPCVLDVMPSSGCYEEVATNLGRLFYRRPLEQVEIDELVDVATFAEGWANMEGVSGPAFDQGLKYELMAMLQAPSFIYIPELGGEPSSSGVRELNQYELASRLSFFLLGHGPDAELLDLAEAGGLATDEDVAALATEMLDRGDAKVALEIFYDELFRLRYLADTPKNATDFPEWSPELAEAMRQETLLLIDDVVWGEDADIRTLYNADYTFVNDQLAMHYGITPPGSGAQFEKVSWPATQNRAGYTSQGSFLAHQSGPLRNSPTKRGKFVLQFLMCRVVPPPPAEVVPELPEPPPGGATLQELLELHMEDPACASCHALTDPVGFAFEHFDTIGRFRTEDESGIPVDGSGELEFLGQWSDAKELGELLATNDEAGLCVIKNLVRGKLGHTETDGEEPAIDELGTSAAERGYSLKSVLVEVASNRLFRYVGAPR